MTNTYTYTQIDELLNEIDNLARLYDSTGYGLPRYEGEVMAAHSGCWLSQD